MTPGRAIAVLGLDNSHPFVDAANLLTLEPDVRLMLVEGEADDRVARMAREFPSVTFLPDVDALLDAQPAGVLVTLRPSRLVPVMSTLASSALPTLINKPGIATSAHLGQVQDAVARPSHRLMTCSVLRFAPAVVDAVAESDDLRTVRVRIGHGVAHWRLPGNEWQADLADGGGVVGSLGYHGFELLDRLFGQRLDIERVAVDGRGGLGLVGGDHAEISGRLEGGAAVTMVLDASLPDERYELSWTDARGDHAFALSPDREDAFGYRATMRAFLSHLDEEQPLPWARSHSLLRTASEAHQLAYGDRTT